MSTGLPRIAIVGTGGTIAGTGASGTQTASYQAATLSVTQLLETLPDLAAQASLQAEQLMQIDSKNLDWPGMLAVARRVAQLAARDDVDGIVVTHGTDTLEETAYLLHLTVRSAKPIVVTGAMRPATALGADGVLNLHDAILTAACPQSTGMGALIVLHGAIHSARDTAKTHTLDLAAFASPHGPLGAVVQGQVRYYRRPGRLHTVDSRFDITTLDTLPRVDIVHAASGADAVACQAFVQAGARGIIHAGPGNGSIADAVLPALLQLQAQGIAVVRASATGRGNIVPPGGQDDSAAVMLSVDDQTPLKARLLLALGLAQQLDNAGLQALFSDY